MGKFFIRFDRIASAFVVAALLFIAPPAVTAEKAETARIGVFAFAGASGDCQNKAFVEGLRELGMVEGQNIVIDCERASGEQTVDAAATALVSRRPDVIVVFGHAPTLAIRRATQEIPIVMSTSGEPVAAGLVASLARPGGNITGVSYYNTELNAKRLEIIKSVVPGAKRIAFIRDPRAPADLLDVYTRHSTEAAKMLGVDLHIVDVSSPGAIDALYPQLVKANVDAVFIMPFHALFKEIPRIVQLAKQFKLPTMHCHKTFVPAGGLMFYGVDYEIQHRRMATYVDKILHGAKPADLPIEQPARFEFHLNRTAADALGLKLSPAVLMRANKVIE